MSTGRHMSYNNLDCPLLHSYIIYITLTVKQINIQSNYSKSNIEIKYLFKCLYYCVEVEVK